MALKHTTWTQIEKNTQKPSLLQQAPASYLAEEAPLCPVTQKRPEPEPASQWKNLWTAQTTPPLSSTHTHSPVSCVPFGWWM